MSASPRFGVILGLLLMAACAVPPPAAYPPVPAPIAEIMPKPPASPDPVLWRPGHWDWTGSAYAWERGEWVPRDGHGTMWLPGFWSEVNGGYVWVPAHWM